MENQLFTNVSVRIFGHHIVHTKNKQRNLWMNKGELSMTRDERVTMEMIGSVLLFALLQSVGILAAITIIFRVNYFEIGLLAAGGWLVGLTGIIFLLLLFFRYGKTLDIH